MQETYTYIHISRNYQIWLVQTLALRWKMSRTIMPCVVRGDRTEYQVPLRNVALCTHGVPASDLVNSALVKCYKDIRILYSRFRVSLYWARIQEMVDWILRNSSWHLRCAQQSSQQGVRDIGPIINLYAYFKSFFFKFSHLLFQTNVLLLFSSKDMSRNATLKLISEYFLDKWR